MESSQTFPVNYNVNSNNRITVVYFKNSSWCFTFTGKSKMKITRSNISEGFSITLCLHIIDTSTSYSISEQLKKSIVEGDASVSFSFNDGGINSSYIEFKGFVTISSVPSPSFYEKTEVPRNPLTESISSLVENFKPLPQLSEDLLRLLNNSESFPDATFKCGTEEIRVHKNILSVRSPILAAIVYDEMQERGTGIVEIADIETNVLQATLKYLYSGKTDHLDDEMAGDVLYAATKYQLDELKKVCVDKLMSAMTVDNVIRALCLGDLHDEGLKTRAKEFVCKCGRFSNLEKTEGWKLLQSQNPRLAMEVLVFALNCAQIESTVSK